MAAGLIDRYRDRLSLEPGDPVVTLNEGATPLIEAPRLSERIEAKAYLKFEGLNPTGSRSRGRRGAGRRRSSAPRPATPRRAAPPTRRGPGCAAR